VLIPIVMVSLLKTEFEHVQLTAAYACRERLSSTFLNEFKFAVSSAVFQEHGWGVLLCVVLERPQLIPKEKLIGSRRPNPGGGRYHR